MWVRFDGTHRKYFSLSEIFGYEKNGTLKVDFLVGTIISLLLKFTETDLQPCKNLMWRYVMCQSRQIQW